MQAPLAAHNEGTFSSHGRRLSDNRYGNVGRTCACWVHVRPLSGIMLSGSSSPRPFSRGIWCRSRRSRSSSKPTWSSGTIVVTACGVFPGSGVVKRRHRPARGQPYPRALAMVAGMPRSRWLRVVSVFRPVCSMAGRIRSAIASSEPARAASHPKDRSGAEEARSALTRREQRLPLGLGCSTGGRGYEIAGACSPSTPMNRTVLEPVNDRLTGNRQRCKPPADEPERCLSRSTTGSPGTASPVQPRPSNPNGA